MKLKALCIYLILLGLIGCQEIFEKTKTDQLFENLPGGETAVLGEDTILNYIETDKQGKKGSCNGRPDLVTQAQIIVSHSDHNASAIGTCEDQYLTLDKAVFAKETFLALNKNQLEKVVTALKATPKSLGILDSKRSECPENEKTVLNGKWACLQQTTLVNCSMLSSYESIQYNIHYYPNKIGVVLQAIKVVAGAVESIHTYDLKLDNGSQSSSMKSYKNEEFSAEIFANGDLVLRDNLNQVIDEAQNCDYEATVASTMPEGFENMGDEDDDNKDSPKLPSGPLLK